MFLKKIKKIYFFICFKFIFLMFSYRFNTLMLKINFKKIKKYYFNIFLNKKYIEKQSIP